MEAAAAQITAAESESQMPRQPVLSWVWQS